MRQNRLRTMHRAGEKILNGWLGIPSPFVAEIMAHAGHDSLTVDAQHGLADFGVALGMLQAIEGTGTVALVRTGALDGPEIMRWLDAGAAGVICPMISTPEQARALVSICRYPPAGERSVGPIRAGLLGGADYIARANDEVLVIGMIETREGLANLDAIVATPGLDGIYVGPNDLSLALGQMPKSEPDHPEVVAAIERIRMATTRAGKIAGIFCSTGEAARARLAQGFDMATPGNDTALLRAASLAAVAAGRG